MNPIEKGHGFEKPKLTYDQILKEHQERGKKLDERFAMQIEQARDGCFKYLEVTSPEELIDELSAEKNGNLKHPFGFHYNIGLEGYGGEVGALSSEERHVYLSEPEDKKVDKSRYEGEEGTGNILGTIKNIVRPGEKMVAFVWKAKGIGQKGKLHRYEHNGVMVDKQARGQDLSFAMYRTYEAVFGEMQREITPKLSLLRLYLKLGFVPKKIINPQDGKELPMAVEPAIERYFSSGSDDLPFLVYLEKEAELKD